MAATPRNPESFMPPAVGLADLLTRFGDIRVKDGQIVSPKGWESANCRTVTNLPGLPGKRLYVNRAIEAPLREALRRCVELRDNYFVRSIACFAPRGKRVNPAHLSVHSWALAVDINPDTNPMRRPLTSDLPSGWVAAFEGEGFTWGGRFSVPDPMHFQWCSGY